MQKLLIYLCIYLFCKVFHEYNNDDCRLEVLNVFV